jgi:hypothetical protein
MKIKKAKKPQIRAKQSETVKVNEKNLKKWRDSGWDCVITVVSCNSTKTPELAVWLFCQTIKTSLSVLDSFKT